MTAMQSLELFMMFLSVIANSWPIAFIVVGLSLIAAIRRTIRQAQAQQATVRADNAIAARDVSRSTTVRS